MEIKKSGSQTAVEGSAEYFTGRVRIEPLFQAHDPARSLGSSVTFEPGARTAWHTHPFGQTLIVTSGVGYVQSWGGPIDEIREGDVVWTPPGEKHWHGASPTTSMTHIAVLEQLPDGKNADWMEKVSDEQYSKLPARASQEKKSDSTTEKKTEPTPSNPYADIAPSLGEYTDKVLYGDLWKRPELSQRDRSLITVATLVALYRTNELPFHVKRAIENGVKKDEIIEIITHLAFYSGWPTANTAIAIAKRVFEEVA